MKRRGFLRSLFCQPGDWARHLLHEFASIWSQVQPEQQRSKLDELFTAVEHFLRTGEPLP